MLWASGTLCDNTRKLWTGGIVVPVDNGEKLQRPQERKLRPAGLAEHLTKFAEGVIIEENLLELRKHLEPRQVGAGMLDACVVLVRALQSCIQDIVQHGDVSTAVIEEADPRLDGVAAVDFVNAYCKFLRCKALRGMLRRTPVLAYLASNIWGCMTTTVWQRCNGQWVQSGSSRGGFQGMRFVMFLFCFSLAYSCDLLPADVTSQLVRVGYQDDTYFVCN